MRVPAPLAMSLGAVRIAHIGLDRLIGYRLTYASGLHGPHVIGLSAEGRRIYGDCATGYDLYNA